MRDLVLIHLITTVVRLASPGGVRSLVAESVLVKHQLLILNRSCQRAPNLHLWDRIVAGWCALFYAAVPADPFGHRSEAVAGELQIFQPQRPMSQRPMSRIVTTRVVWLMRPVRVAKTLNSKISSETARRNRDRIVGVPETSPGMRAIAWLTRIHTYIRMESGPTVSELISGVVRSQRQVLIGNPESARITLIQAACLSWSTENHAQFWCRLGALLVHYNLQMTAS
jgi:hypothetical protein